MRVGIAPVPGASRRAARGRRWCRASAAGGWLLALLFAAAETRAQDDPTYARVILEDDSGSVAPAAGMAVIVFVRELRVRRDALPDEVVYVDEDPAGLLRERSWFARQVPPGRHVIWGVRQGRDLVLECRAGRRYLLRLSEILNDKDEISRDWLRDHPDGLGRLIQRLGLRRAVTTPNGAAWAAGRRRHLSHVPAPGAVDESLDTPGPWSFGNIASERPLEQMTLENDRTHLSGRIVTDRDTLRYRLRDRVLDTLTSWRVVSDSVDIAWSQVVLIRLGGTRFTGLSPWVDVVYRGAEGLRIASFADLDDVTGAASYNRMFARLDDLLQSRRDETLAGTPPPPARNTEH